MDDNHHSEQSPEISWDPSLRLAYELLENSSETFFLTGRAGTGKSTLLKYFKTTTRKKFVVLAPTGIAALHVGGSTIHSFFGFPLRQLIYNDPDIRAWGTEHPRLKILWEVDTIVIDEISMVRADLLDGIDQSLRMNLKNDAPFGGKQLVFIGDVFQLPPVVTAADKAYHEDDDLYSPYFFDAQSFRNARPRIIALDTIYRQRDEQFIYVLNRIRNGIANQSDLDVLNERVGHEQESEFTITLTTTNAAADLINAQRLMNLASVSHTFNGVTDGDFDQRTMPAPQRLTLKIGAQVMMVRNDPFGRWVNGSIGHVHHLDDNEVWIRTQDGKIHRVEKALWENKSYSWNRSENTIDFVIKGTYIQYPMRLAWAITIHKSQGLTFDSINIDLGKGTFAHGQLYVALSRCRSLTGLTLNRKIELKDIIVNEAVAHFARQLKMN